MNLEERIFTKLFMNWATVIGKKEIAEKVFHFTLEVSINFTGLIPGQHLRLLLFPNQKGKLRDRVRTYSIWRCQCDGKKSYIDIAVCAHTDGPGSKWAEITKVGSQVLISRPLGKFTLDTTKPKHLFIGDITALSHFYCFTHHLTPQQEINGIIYGKDEKQLFTDFDGTLGFTFQKTANGTDTSLLAYYRSLKIGRDTRVYIGGDGHLCIALNNLFVKELGLPRKQLKVKPFWILGKTGLE
ncbi:SIP domain-containing protein [Sphingobacterium sp. InxBP1]|uniref:siderophore-interacting protein n=1 Tax=Sphingobacterium sp. InxBP1 TaxID=2870328 RepID=UPI0022439249|nr:SIP domain-containing protein [Sphingobacterium sp. InxBP1]MCW8313816.1 SIP domain-containing protein [Sphingobacterium sp. InxBP1]